MPVETSADIDVSPEKAIGVCPAFRFNFSSSGDIRPDMEICRLLFLGVSLARGDGDRTGESN